jgi:hypothetical protein
VHLLEEFEGKKQTLVLIDLINSFIHVASRLVCVFKDESHNGEEFNAPY